MRSAAVECFFRDFLQIYHLGFCELDEHMLCPLVDRAE